MAARNSTAAPTLVVLRRSPYVEMPLNEISKKTGLEPKQVANAIAGLRASGIRIESPIKGVYRYVPSDVNTTKKEEAHRPSKQLFEELGRTKSGEIIVEGEDGALYKLCEI